jgi:hypothetical protein
MHGINNGENLDFLSEAPSKVLRVLGKSSFLKMSWRPTVTTVGRQFERFGAFKSFEGSQKISVLKKMSHKGQN